MLKVDDKDAIISHLTETLDKVDSMLNNLKYFDYFCNECWDTTVNSGRFYDDINKIHDYIWHRKADITF